MENDTYDARLNSSALNGSNARLGSQSVEHWASSSASITQTDRYHAIPSWEILLTLDS
jgi:hypothetical protein